MSTKPLSQNLALVLVCAAVVGLLAPYAGCGVDTVESPVPSDRQPESPAIFEQSSDPAQPPRSAGKPLEQIEELLPD